MTLDKFLHPTLQNKIRLNHRQLPAAFLSRSVLAGPWIVYSPLEGSKFCKLVEITRIGSYHCYSQTACAHRNQCVVGQSPLSYLLVIVLCGKTSKHFPSLSPICEIGDKNPKIRLPQVSYQKHIPRRRAVLSNCPGKPPPPDSRNNHSTTRRKDSMPSISSHRRFKEKRPREGAGGGFPRLGRSSSPCYNRMFHGRSPFRERPLHQSVRLRRTLFLFLFSVLAGYIQHETSGANSAMARQFGKGHKKSKDWAA